MKNHLYIQNTLKCGEFSIQVELLISMYDICVFFVCRIFLFIQKLGGRVQTITNSRQKSRR